MTNTNLFQKKLIEEKRTHNEGVRTRKKNTNPKSNTPDEVLEEEHERFVKYVELDFDKKDVPISDDEIRNHIKSSFRKKPDIHWLEKYASNDAYRFLISDVWATPEYQKAIDSRKTKIRIKRKTRKQERTGIDFSDKYYYIIIKPRTTKKGTRISATRRFYSKTTGKQIKTKNVNKYMGTKKSNNDNNLVEIKQKSSLKAYRDKQKSKDRLRRLRGKE